MPVGGHASSAAAKASAAATTEVAPAREEEDLGANAGVDGEEEAAHEDEVITEHARLLKRLIHHEAQIRGLQAQRDHLAQQIEATNRIATAQAAIRRAEEISCGSSRKSIRFATRQEQTEMS